MAAEDADPQRPSEWLDAQKGPDQRPSEWLDEQPGQPSAGQVNTKRENLATGKSKDPWYVHAIGAGLAASVWALIKVRGGWDDKLAVALLVGVAVTVAVTGLYIGWWVVKALFRKKRYAVLGGLTCAAAYLVTQWPSYGGLDTHLIKAAIFGFKAWSIFFVTGWLYRNAALIISAVVTFVLLPAAAAVGAFVANPHCEPDRSENAVDALVCLGVSTLEPDLAIGELLLLPSTITSNAPSLADTHEPTRLLNTSGAVQPVFVENGSSQVRFYNCMDTLYEDPAKRIETRAITRYSFDHEQAHDIAMAMLFNVCMTYETREIANLSAYYWASATHEMQRRRRHAGAERRWLNQLSWESECWNPSAAGFNTEELALLENAVDRLDYQYQIVVRTYLDGGSFSDLAQQLGLERQVVYDRFAYAKKKLRLALAAKGCRIKQSYWQ